MLSCVEHGCLLLPERDVAVARALGEQIKPVPAGEPLATLDRYTHTALDEGMARIAFLLLALFAE